ncbi:MAG: membrane protein of unknown function [Promethearchaeota archaeon]|nr:MAG: membrane protein of unknown function [Candidatus Lokiarchaeota archaeon]
MIRKEFGRIRSDKRTLILLFAIPLILIIVFGLTSGGGPTEFFNVSIISKDSIPTYENFPENSSQYADDFINVFEGNLSSFGFKGYRNVTNPEEYEEAKSFYTQWLKDEVIDVFLVLPENFSETVENNTDIPIIFYIDGSDSDAVSAINVTMFEPIAQFRIKIGKTANFTYFIPYLEFEVPFWEAQVVNYAFALTIPLIIIGTTMNLSCLSIVSEGPLPRMLITPTSKRSIILSKLIANSAIMSIQVAEIFVATALFGLYSLGSLFELFLVLLAIGFSGVSIGLFISSLSGTDQQANQLYIMFFIVILIFSGQFISADNLPVFMQAIIYSFPLYHSIPLVLEITLKGLPVDIYSLLIVVIIALIYDALAYIVYMFKKVEV